MLFAIRPHHLSYMLLGVAVLLGACGSTEPEQTATAGYQIARAEFESLQATATVVRARMQTTLDYVGTRVVQAEEAGEFLRFNLINLGMDRDTIEESVKQLAILPAGATATSLRAEPALDATPGNEPTAAARAIVTPPAASTAATETVGGPRLDDLVMASGVDANDCPLDINPTFTTQSQEIYVVARVFDIPANASIAASWQRLGTEVALISFSNARYIDGTCIWLYIDQTVTPFIAGNWSVEVRIDGTPVSPPLTFEIVET